jgi:hypothetical protein
LDESASFCNQKGIRKLPNRIVIYGPFKTTKGYDRISFPSNDPPKVPQAPQISCKGKAKIPFGNL